MSSMELKNTYFVLRHGSSKANAKSLIISSPENGVKEEYDLTEDGMKQAREAGLWLRHLLREADVAAEDLVVLSSPFSRTRTTARQCLTALKSGALPVKAAALAVADLDEQITVSEALRERFFGAALEGQLHAAYRDVWDADAKDSAARPGGDGESVDQVAARLKALLAELEAKHAGAHILLVSHGDTLSILESIVKGGDLKEHRAYGSVTGELRRLNQ